MTTVRTRSWLVITGRRWRKCFSTWPAAAVGRARRENTRSRRRDRAASDQCDDPALLVSVDFVMATAAGTALLARAADHHLGIPADLHHAECRVFRARRRHADRRGDLVGH